MVIITSPLAQIKLPMGEAFHDYFFRETARYGDKVAFISRATREEVTFPQIRSRACMLARALLAMGIEKGEVVLLALDNRPETICLLLASSMAGAVTSTISPKFHADEMNDQIDHSYTRFAFVVPSSINAVRSVFEKLKRDFRLICVGSREESQGLPILSDLQLTIELLDAPVPFPNIIPEEDVVYLPFSSGIHGDKKGILITHEVFCQQIAVANHPFYDNPRLGEYTVSMLPYSRHIGIEACFIALLNGATVVTTPESDAKVFMECIEIYEVRCVFTTPYTVHEMTQVPPCDAPQMRSLKTVCVGTACLTRTVHEAFIHRFPQTRVVSMYGMTETGMLARSKPRRTYAKNVGYIASTIYVKVLDMITGEELPRGVKGVLYIAGPSTSPPYLDCDELNPIGGWRKTGDVGFVDGQELLHVIDRARDIIKVFGVQVIPQELEEILSTHNAVNECAVVGVKDDQAGERPIAYVVLRPQAQVTREELIDYVNERVCRAKRLLRIELAATLPRTSCGAILRRLLAEAANLSITDALASV